VGVLSYITGKKKTINLSLGAIRKRGESQSKWKYLAEVPLYSRTWGLGDLPCQNRKKDF